MGKENFRKIKEKKLKLAQISNFLSPSSQPQKPQANATKKDDNSSKYFSKNTNDALTCPICSLDLTKLAINERDVHVNKCLEQPKTSDALSNDFKYKPTKKFSRSESNDELSEQNKEQQHQTKSAEEKCQDAKSKINETLLKDAVPNCPICGKVFHTFNQRQSHLKKCAQVFRIKTENLVELIKKQQERIERDLSKGLIPSEVYIPQLKTKLGLPKSRSKKSKILDSTQTQLTNLGVVASNSKPIITSKKKGKSNNEPSKLTQLDEKAKSENLTERFEKILKKIITYSNTETIQENVSLVKTKFSQSGNYIWNKCKYFKETKESFYVAAFVETGQFFVNSRVFIDRVDEKRFSNVTLINTQTAFLLADLNDTTQRENLSVYYTQDQSLYEFQTQANRLFEKSRINYECESNRINECDSIENSQIEIKSSQQIDPPVGESENNLEDNQDMSRSKGGSTQLVKSAKDLFEDSQIIDNEDEESDGLADANASVSKQPTQKKAESQPKAIFIIDETRLDEESCETDDNEPAVIEDENEDLARRKSLSNKTKSSAGEPADSQHDSSSTNICDQTLDMLELENEQEDPHKITVILDADDQEEDKVANDSMTLKNQANCSKNERRLSMTKKRKSIDIIELNDSSESSDSNKKLDEIIEEEKSKKFKPESDDLIEISSSPSTQKDAHKEADNIDDDDQLNANELLSLLNKTTPNVANHKAVLSQANQSLDDVWRNFGEDNQDDYGTNMELNYEDEISSNPHKRLSLESAKQAPPIDADEETTEEDFDVDEFIRNYRDKLEGAQKNKKPTCETEEEHEEEMVQTKPSPQVERENPSPKPKKTAANNVRKKTAVANDSETPVNNRLLANVRDQDRQVSITPMPNYHGMDTPNLKVELKKYGIKALPKRQAILKLTEIYEYTHRHKLASLPRSHSFNDLSEGTSISTAKATSSFDKEVEERTNQKEANKKRTMKKTISDLNLNTRLIGKNQFRTEIVEENDSPQQSNLLRIKPVGTNKPPKPPKPSSKTSKQAQSRLQECTLDDKMLEMIEQDDSEEDGGEQGVLISASQRARKQSKFLDENETQQFLFDYLKKEPNYYLSILSYDPIDYEKFFNEIQTVISPRKVNNKILMKCLDEFCVTFTLKAINAKSFGSQRAKTQKHHKS